ncbi:MAG: hypothetical protein QX189_17565 [Methylococcales bacterium]
MNAAHVFGSGTGLYSDQQFYDIAFVPAPPPVVVPPVVKPSDDIKPEVARKVEHKTVIQVNLNFITPLQVSTTFLGQYYEFHAIHDDYVNADYGQYKHDHTFDHYSNDSNTFIDVKQDQKNNSLSDLLYIIKNNGIKLPAGLLDNIKF